MERSTPYACHDWWHVDNDGRVGDGGAWWRMVVCGGWWCVEDGGGVCGQSSQACFHAGCVEMDNLTLTRRSSTYAACAHVPPICIPRSPLPPLPLPLRTRRQIAPSIQSTIRGRTSTDTSRHHASRNHPRANTKEKNRKRRSPQAMPRVHNSNLMHARRCSSVPT